MRTNNSNYSLMHFNGEEKYIYHDKNQWFIGL